MAAKNLPPRLIEKRSDERQVFALVNALRDNASTAGGGGGSGGPSFSSDMLGSNSGAEEVVDQLELPAADVYTFSLGGQMQSAGGTGHAYLRFGGGDRTVDGAVVLALDQPSASFSRIVNAAAQMSSGGVTRLKLSLKSAAPGQYVKIKDIFLGIS